MDTEALFTPGNVVREQEVSPALLPHAPDVVRITTKRGKDVPLALAGYRLHMGRTYQIRVAGTLQAVRLVGYPGSLVKRQGDAVELTENGVRYLCQALCVSRAGFWSMVSNLGIYPDELEIEVVFDDGHKASVSLPVVLELGFTWKLVLLLILWALFLSATELLSTAFWEHRTELLTSPLPWIRAFGLALLYPVLTCVRRVYGLNKRARELSQQFRASWQQTAPNTASPQDA
jgi:hypothetical protein